MAHGVARLTMVDLARAVGVTRRTLYNYFSSRDDAFRQMYSQFNAEILETAWQRCNALRAEGASVLDIIAAVIDNRYGDIWRTLNPSPYSNELKGTVFHLCTDLMIQQAITFQGDLVRLVESLAAEGRLELKPGFTPERLVQMLTDSARGVNQVYPPSPLEDLYGHYRDTCQAILYGYCRDENN